MLLFEINNPLTNNIDQIYIKGLNNIRTLQITHNNVGTVWGAALKAIFAA